jgi:hypothetical protein
MTVKTIRSAKFYFWLSIAVLLPLILGTGLIILLFHFIGEGQIEFRDYFLPVFSLFFYALGLYALYTYIRNAPSIKADHEKISIGRTTYFWTELSSIMLLGKQPFGFIFSVPMEGIKLRFKDGQVRYIYDDFYSNTSQLKSFLDQVVVRKQEYKAVIVESDAAHKETTDIEFQFKGKQFTSFRGLMLWGFIAFCTFLMATLPQPISLGLGVFFLCFMLFWMCIQSYCMYYFEMSSSYFRIRNHNFFWVNRAFGFGDIKHIVFETRGKMPNCLRIVTTDFKSKLYPAGTLKDETWLELKLKLEEKGVQVRNESIFTPFK